MDVGCANPRDFRLREPALLKGVLVKLGMVGVCIFLAIWGPSE